jgi:hypothetical protein
MKRIFIRPIGTIRDLGAARVWILEFACMLAWVLVLAALLIIF